jgi:hypothetical protein
MAGTTTPTVLLLTDSLAFPRSEPEVVKYEETWVALLKRRFPAVDFVHCGRGGATIVDLHKHSAYYHGTISPTLVLVQSGIVDCAPRALTVVEQQVLQRLPILGPPLSALARRHAPILRRWRRMSYTSLPAFEAWADRFEALFGNVHWIGILPAHSNYEMRAEGIGDAIDRYNAVLRRRRFVPTDDFTANDIMSDLHHLNVTGHRRLADRLAEVVQRALATAALDGGATCANEPAASQGA